MFLNFNVHTTHTRNLLECRFQGPICKDCNSSLGFRRERFSLLSSLSCGQDVISDLWIASFGGEGSHPLKAVWQEAQPRNEAHGHPVLCSPSFPISKTENFRIPK